MSLTAEQLQFMLDRGLTLADAVEFARLGGGEPTRSAAAERQRRYRERKAETVTRDVTRDVTESPKQKVSPTPPSKTHTPSSPPIVPPTKVDLDEVAERIWSLQPKLDGKRRQTKPDVRKALTTVLRSAEPEAVIRACAAYYALPASTKEGGAYAMGAARLLQNDRWREFLNADAPAQRVQIAPFPDDEIRNAVLSAKGDAWTASWLDPCSWEAERRVIVPRTGLAAQKLRAEVSRVLQARHVTIQELAA